MKTRTRNVLRPLAFIFLAVIAICIVDFPVYWMVKTSLQPVNSIVTKNVSLGIDHWDFSGYKNVWLSLDYASHIAFRQNMINSFVVVGLASFISIVFAILAGYSLSRFKYRGREAISQGILYVYMFPQLVLVIPLLVLVIKLGLYNSLASLVIVYCTFALPYSIWMMKGYFAGIPRELEEAAMVDGCSRLAAIRRIILPVAAPGIVATVVYSFILGWNNVIYPLTFITQESRKVVAVGFLSLISGDVTPWNAVMAASVLTSIPVVILFLFLQTALVKGLTAGAVKS
ncbi:MAG TPA: carbohydrate ABC transporter permease [Spirochaetia bacterium]|nr:carbohydrate ABC transporter permease [Spirochaetia bacterium]